MFTNNLQGYLKAVGNVISFNIVQANHHMIHISEYNYQSAVLN